MSATGHIHAGPLTSRRLRQVLRVLSDGRPHSTREVRSKAKVEAVPAVVAELRHHGAEINCQRVAMPDGSGFRWFYTMTKAPKT